MVNPETTQRIAGAEANRLDDHYTTSRQISVIRPQEARGSGGDTVHDLGSATTPPPQSYTNR